MQKITLWNDGRAWMATFSDPEVKRLFGTDTLPTSSTARRPASEVLEAIRHRNPGCEVTVRTA